MRRNKKIEKQKKQFNFSFKLLVRITHYGIDRELREIGAC